MTLIGVDAGGTWIKAARFSKSFEIEEKTKIPSGARHGIKPYFTSIVSAVIKLAEPGRDLNVGLSMPGGFTKDRSGIIVSPNVLGLDGSDPPLAYRQILSKSLSTNNISGENDAACAALAEWQQGIGQAEKKSRLLFLTWGTGIGTALIDGGKISYGWEAGHLPISWTEPSLFPCGCGSHVDLESRISVPHIVRQVAHLMRTKAAPTALTEADFIDQRQTPIILVDKAESGDQLAELVINEALLWMARGLHALSTIAWPEVVVIGGAMMDRPWLLKRLQYYIDQETSGYLKNTLRAKQVNRAILGNDAGMIGAAIVATQYPMSE